MSEPATLFADPPAPDAADEADARGDSSARGASSEHLRRIEELGQMIAVYNDATERLRESHDQLTATVQSLRQELSEKNRLLERKNRLAALGEMAAGMAHEIRNPLGGIELYASLLAKDLADRPEAVRQAKKISAGVKRLEALVGQVLQFAREIEASPAPTDLADVVEQAVEYAAQAMNARQIRCEVAGPRPMPVVADARLLEQAVLNLVLNAAEAMGEAPDSADASEANAGRPCAAHSDSAADPGERRITVTFGPPPAGSGARQFQLAVQDAGPGIPPAALERIFNPFFTTKATGTGLGLSIVHRIVEAHDGAIVAANAPAGGARFEMRV